MEAHAALGAANPQTMASLTEGYRYARLTSTYGGVPQRWILVYSAPRAPQARRTGNKQHLQRREREATAFAPLCRTPCACAADAQQALETFGRS